MANDRVIKLDTRNIFPGPHAQQPRGSITGIASAVEDGSIVAEGSMVPEGADVAAETTDEQKITISNEIIRMIEKAFIVFFTFELANII